METFQTTTIIDGQHATIKELADSGSREYTSGDNPVAVVRYRGAGYADTSAAYTAINSLLYTDPPLEPFALGYDGKPRFHGLPITSIQVTRLVNSRLYDIAVNCSIPAFSSGAGVNDNPPADINTPGYNMPAIEDNQYSFNTTTFSAHVDRGRYVLGRARYDGGEPVQFMGIGPTTDGRFSGAEMLVPCQSFTITRSEPRWYINMARRQLFATLTGTINQAVFGGYAPRAVMFAGVTTTRKVLEYTQSGETVKDWYWQTQYNFNIRPASTLSVGETVLNVGPWDVTSFEDASVQVSGGSSSGVPVFMPGQVSVWGLYDVADFAQLGLVFPA